MNKYIRVLLLTAAGALLTFAGAATTAHADVSRLDWMSGAWGGEVGNAYLEESWNVPRAGTIAAVVRFSTLATEDKPSQAIFIELITISNADDGGLMLHIQQFSEALEPRFPPQPMRMSEIADRSVSFSATEVGGGLAKVSYRLSDEGVFTVEVDLVEGNKFLANLTRQED